MMDSNYRLKRNNPNRNQQEYMSSVDENLNDEVTIDLGELFEQIKKHIVALILLVVIGGIGAGLFSWFFIPATYASSGTLFLTPSVSEGEVDINSINSNQKLVTNVMNLLTQDNIMSVVAQETGLQSAQDVRDVLTVNNVNNTEIITITATTGDAKLSKEIVEDTINIFIDTMQESLNIKNITITNPPKLDYNPVGPSILKNSVSGALIGLLVGMGWIVIRMMTDKRLKTREEAEKFLGIPVYAELPDLEDKKSR